jgi:hypothetical protein
MPISHELQDKIEVLVKAGTDHVIHGHNLKNQKNFNDNDYEKRILNERINGEGIFFDNFLNQEIKIPKKTLAQINIKKESNLPAYNPLFTSDLKNLISFFTNEPYINIYNFNKAEILLKKFINFKAINDIQELKHKLQELQQELDKSISDLNKFGKALLHWSLKTNGLKLTLIRTKIQGLKQFVAIDFTKESKITILNCWSKEPGVQLKNELIKRRSQYTCNKKSDSHSINFDAEVWKSFNFGDISFKNYEKTLDCIERNRNTLPELIKQVNKKNLFQVVHEPYLNKVAIKSDNRETTFLNFETRSCQKVTIKLCSYASCITIE